MSKTAEYTSAAIKKELMLELRTAFPNWSVAAILRHSLLQQQNKVDRDRFLENILED